MKRSRKTSKTKPKPIKFRDSLFWDVDPRKLDPDRNATYMIERILDFGTDREVKWMHDYYSKQRIRKVLQLSRVVHNKSKALWNLIYT